MLEAIERQSYKTLCNHLAASDIDYLKSFPELDKYTVEAADGHFIDHACIPRGADEKVYAAGFIYAMNLRNGLLRPLCCITNGTQRHHELPILRNHIDHQNSQCDPPEKNLYVYDKAVTDFLWWAKQKDYQNYMISVLKDTWVKSIAFDASDPLTRVLKTTVLLKTKG